MKEHGLFSNKQFTFLSEKSTTLQFIRVLDVWTMILDEVGASDMIYFSFMTHFAKGNPRKHQSHHNTKRIGEQ